MKRLMERYCFLHKDYEPPTFRALDPWELQIEHICRSISKRTGLLRRLGCHPHGLTCSTARLAACTLTDAVSIINSEVWSSSCPEDQSHRACPASLREGRRLKTKFRLGCHDLRSSSSRMQLVRNAQCPCCESRESETIQYTLFECTAFEEEREVFLSRLYSVCPIARQLDDEYRCRLIMGDRLPREIENSLYRYLSAISKLRLGILTERGEGS